MSDPFAQPSPNKTHVGPYRIVRELGHGGMGHVFEGVHQHLQRRVAIKRLHPDLARDPVQVERFVREGRAACNIRHPHVVEVYEFGFDDGAPYLVMDLLHGRTLAEHLVAVNALPLTELARLLLPVLSAVAAAHADGIVHRDLKPSNIMLAQIGGRCVPKVLDFGTSKLIDDASQHQLTHSAALLGTPYYMSPEQLRSSRDVDARCDQYALGVMLYECATGVRPFEADSSYNLMHAIMTAPVAAPSALQPELPKAFDALVARAMQRDRDRRFADVRALAAALLPLADAAEQRRWQDEFVAAPAADGGEPPLRESRTWVDAAVAREVGPAASGVVERRRSRVTLLAGAAIAIALGGAYAWYARHTPTAAVSDRTTARPASEPAAQRSAAAVSDPSTAAATAHPASVPAAQPSAAAVSDKTTAAATVRRASEPAAQHPSAAVSDAPTAAATARPTSEPAAQHPSAAVSGTAPATTRPTENHARPRKSAPARAVTIGDNGAPILE